MSDFSFFFHLFAMTGLWWTVHVCCYTLLGVFMSKFFISIVVVTTQISSNAIWVRIYLFILVMGKAERENQRSFLLSTDWRPDGCCNLIWSRLQSGARSFICLSLPQEWGRPEYFGHLVFPGTLTGAWTCSWVASPPAPW